MWWRSHYFRETDNAYVSGHIHPVSARITGVVTKVLITDNQLVQAGEPLAQMDPQDHLVKMEQIRAQLGSIDQQVVQAGAQISQARAQLVAAEAQALQAAAQLGQSRRDTERLRNLYNDDIKIIAKADLDTSLATMEGAEANLASRRSMIAAARSQVDVALAARDALLAQKKAMAAQLRDAELQSSYNRIVAPVSGRVGKRTVEVGSRVQPGQQLLAIIQDEVWVTANFKETQLHGLHPGQAATVQVDALHGTTLKGRVDSFSPASGAQFALLPPDNATGNFTRVVQRVPVKIVFPPDVAGSVAGRLVPGMSSVVEIDLRQPATDRMAAVGSGVQSR